jgi:FkbM family methyltransferase
VHKPPIISYAQHYEDLNLLRCFEAQEHGFYIDVGAGHPVYDNVSLAFYLRGWSGITVEPNPWLAQLSEAVRPRDRQVRSLLGAAEGETTYYLVEDFHGPSTTVESHARAALSEYGKRAQAMAMPVTTLAVLCQRFAPGVIDFLKIDVEGAERAVLEGGDWDRFRPRLVVLEAVAPVTLAPAWQAWEPLLTGHGYRFVSFDGLNRYYVAREHATLAEPLAAGSPEPAGVVRFRDFGPALDDPAHPDHRLARLLEGADMVRLPLAPAEDIAERLMADLPPADRERPAGDLDISALHRRLFGSEPAPDSAASLELPADAPIRDLYRHVAESESFRIACGRISASYAW